ncbi:hypothetical protein Cus16_2951 [Curtobacterium sp. ER1/6]|nr:hypothetical protein Cus16_2951 [Curtobacterium sp. ER1/6]
MRDPQHDDVAGRQPGRGVRQREVAVLVVEAGDGDRPRRRDDLRVVCRASRPDPADHRKALVEGDVALADGDEGPTRFGARRDPAPDLDRGAERALLGSPAERGALGVEPVVVGEVRTGAEEHVDVVRPVRDGVDHAVEPGAAAHAEQRPVRGDERTELHRDREHLRHPVPRGVDVGQPALVPGHPAERQPGVHGRPGDGACLVGRSDAGASAREADLDEDVHVAVDVALGAGGRLDAGDRVDVAEDVGGRVLGATGGEPGEAGRVEHLVGDEDVVRSVCPRDHRLLHRRDGDAPRAGTHLPVGEGGGHVRLHVRREEQAVPLGVGLHDGRVVLQRGLAQGHHRQVRVVEHVTADGGGGGVRRTLRRDGAGRAGRRGGAVVRGGGRHRSSCVVAVGQRSR